MNDRGVDNGTLSTLERRRKDLWSTLKPGDDVFVLAESSSNWGFDIAHIVHIDKVRRETDIRLKRATNKCQKRANCL